MQNEKLKPYLNPQQCVKDYFELIDLYIQRTKTRREFNSVRYKDKKPKYAEDSKKDTEELKQKHPYEDDFKDFALSDCIMEKQEEITAREKLSKEHNIKLPVTKIKNKYKLDDIEVKILFFLLKAEIMPSSLNNRTPKTNEILELFFEDITEVIEARKYFYENSRLVENNLIVRESYRNIISSQDRFFVPEHIVREILGHNNSKNKVKRKFKSLRNSFVGNIIKPEITLKQVVLEEGIKEEIIKCLAQVKNEKTMFKNWGFSKVIKYGKGITMLFAGAPGTGKTMTAEAVANYLNKKLLVADISQIVNCFVGETEKNVVAIFNEAKEKNAVLFFDEADSLFYNRLSQTTRAIDVSFNREVNVILQEIEKYSGVVILSTNRSMGMDEALERRISLKIEFEVPNAQLREEIWKNHIPENAPLADDIDFKLLAQQFELAGGHIKNAVLNAARAAVSRGETSKITMQDLIGYASKEIHGGKFFKDTSRTGFRQNFN